MKSLINRRMLLSAVASLIAIGLLPGATLFADDKNEFKERIELTATGVIQGAKGEARVKFEIEDDGEVEQELEVEVSNLSQGSFTLKVDGNAIATFNVDATGSAEVEFKGSAIPKEIDPVINIKLVQVIDSSNRVVLTGNFAGANAPRKPSALARVELQSTGIDADARGSAQIRVRPRGNQEEKEFAVVVFNLAARTSFLIHVDGKLAGAITTNTLGRGEVEFSTDPDHGKGECKLPLPLVADAVTQLKVVEVSDAEGKVLLRGDFSKIEPPIIEDARIKFQLTANAAVDADAEGNVSIRIKRRGLFVEQRIDIKVKNLDPRASYDIFFNGSAQAAGSIVTNSSGEAEIRFTNAPADAEDILLPATIVNVALIQKVEIKKAGQVVLSGNR